MLRSPRVQQDGQGDGTCARAQQVRCIDHAGRSRQSGEARGNDKTEEQERHRKDDREQAEEEELRPVPGQAGRIKGDEADNEIACGNGDGKQQDIGGNLPVVLQKRDDGQECAARADAEHGNAHDQEGEMIPQGDGDIRISASSYARLAKEAMKTRGRMDRRVSACPVMLYCSTGIAATSRDPDGDRWKRRIGKNDQGG